MAAAMSIALTVAVGSFSQTALAQTQAAANDCFIWIDAKTGKQVLTGPPGWSPILDPDRLFSGGHNYAKQSDGTWIDTATGKQVLTGPPGWSPILDPDRLFSGGRNYVRVPCPPPPPEHATAPQPPGTGFYVGFNASGASGSSRWLEPEPAVSTNTFGVSGGLAGATFGYQAWNGPLLLSLEADIAGGGISGDTSVGCFTPCRTSSSWLATVRGRVGFDIGPVTPFVTGGLAVGDVNAHVGAFPGAGTTQAGWAAGAGLQLPLSTLAGGLPDELIAKAEWLHVDLGSPLVCSPATCGGVANVNFQAEVFRVGINIPLTALMPR